MENIIRIGSVPGVFGRGERKISSSEDSLKETVTKILSEAEENLPRSLGLIWMDGKK